MDKLEQLKKLCAEATPGPWRYRDLDESIVGNKLIGKEIVHAEEPVISPFSFPRDNEWQDGLFIAALRNNAEKLLALWAAVKYEKHCADTNDTMAAGNAWQQMLEALADLEQE